VFILFAYFYDEDLSIWNLTLPSDVVSLSAELFEVSSVLMFKLQFNHMV
jgi:hypothetical protein